MLHYEIKFLKIITRELVKKNPNSLFIFGDNCRRKGTGGQAVIRGMQNVAGIATKIEPNMNDNAFFSDSNYQFATNVIFTDIENIKIRLSSGEYTTVVFPLDGLGTGLAKLEDKAPKVNQYLHQKLYDDFKIVSLKNLAGHTYLDLIKY